MTSAIAAQPQFYRPSAWREESIQSRFAMIASLKHGAVEKVPRRRESTVRTGAGACPCTGRDGSVGADRCVRPCRRLETNPPYPPLTGGQKKSKPSLPGRRKKSPRQTGKSNAPSGRWGRIVFCAPLSRGGRGGCLYGISLSWRLPFPSPGDFPTTPCGPSCAPAHGPAERVVCGCDKLGLDIRPRPLALETKTLA